MEAHSLAQIPSVLQGDHLFMFQPLSQSNPSVATAHEHASDPAPQWPTTLAPCEAARIRASTSLSSKELVKKQSLESRSVIVEKSRCLCCCWKTGFHEGCHWGVVSCGLGRFRPHAAKTCHSTMVCSEAPDITGARCAARFFSFSALYQ